MQFHPEVVHTPKGAALLANFVHAIAGCAGDAVAQRVQHTLSGDTVWQGRLADGREGQIHLVVSSGRLTGSVTAAGSEWSAWPRPAPRPTA